MRLPFFPAIAMLIGSAFAATAQELPICHHAGKTYSPGSVIPIGNVPNACAKAPGSSGMIWLPVTEAEVNCLYGGEEYSRGSLIAVGEKMIGCAKGVRYTRENRSWRCRLKRSLLRRTGRTTTRLLTSYRR
jgi:hypothetical protein